MPEDMECCLSWGGDGHGVPACHVCCTSVSLKGFSSCHFSLCFPCKLGRARLFAVKGYDVVSCVASQRDTDFASWELFSVIHLGYDLCVLVTNFSRDQDHCSTSSKDILEKKGEIAVGLSVSQSIKKFK